MNKNMLTFVLVLAIGLTPWMNDPARGTGSQASRMNGEPLAAAPEAASPTGERGLADLPPAAQSAVSETFGQQDPRYQIQPAGEGYSAANPAHGLQAEWNASGMTVLLGQERWQLRLAGWGYGDEWQAVQPASPQARGNRLEYPRGSMTEWYVNGPLGMEQGFTLQQPPSPNPGRAPLTLALEQSGDLRASLDNGNLALQRKDGTTVLRYGKIYATDAAGRSLPAWLELQGERVLLRVDDAGARYPLVVDPYVEQALLSAFGDIPRRFSAQAALSQDGIYALVGAPGEENYKGAAYVFKISNGVWGLQARLAAADGIAGDCLGTSVALNQDGSTALVGGSCLSTKGSGEAYVFVREVNLHWSQQARLYDSSQEMYELFGWGVALSADGNTALVGAPFKDIGGLIDQGSATLFTRSGVAWSQAAELVLPWVGYAGANFGWAVALSGNGNTALVGAPGKEAAYLFRSTGGVWSFQAYLTAALGTPGDYFGGAVALNGDGSTALVGAPGDGTLSVAEHGSAFVFGGSAWSLLAKLAAADPAAYDNFGASVALSSDGWTALVGAAGADVNGNVDQGAAYAFTSTWMAWSQQQKLTPVDGGPHGHFGDSVSLSGDGITALAGTFTAPLRSAALFKRSAGVWSQLAQLPAGDSTQLNEFGNSVAVSDDGNTVLVGAIGDFDGEGYYQGAAYVFVRSSGVWLAQQKLLASDGTSDDGFGYDVALSADGNTALVGAPFHDVNSIYDQGSAYVFTRSSGVWSEQANWVLPWGGFDFACFGESVALSDNGNTALVGASGKEVASLFKRSSPPWTGNPWSFQTFLLAADGTPGDKFGKAVALSGDGYTALVGAPFNWHEDASDYGSAYAYTFNGSSWGQQTFLTAADKSDSDHFGADVALDGDGNTALIGTASLYGGAFIFTHVGSVWSQQGPRLNVLDDRIFDLFGYSVALGDDGDTALIGCPFLDIAGHSDQGAAYVFVRNGSLWELQGQMADLGFGQSDDHFGTAVALRADGGMALVGAGSWSWSYERHDGAGHTYIYNLPLPTVLVGPGFGAILHDLQPTLMWQAEPAASSYLLKLDGVVIDVGNATQYTPPPPLTPGLHFWSVACVDALGNVSPYTPTSWFTNGWISLPLVMR